MDSLRDLSVAAERCFLRALGVYELQPAETADDDLRALGRDYGIKIVTKDQLDCADLSYDAPTNTQLKNAKSKIVEEMRLYPKEAIEKTRIEQIVLCRNLRLGEKRAAGTLKVGLHYVDTLFLDVSVFRFSVIHGRRTFHHEIYHAIDFRDTFHGYADAAWGKLQGDDFQYELDRAIELHHYLGSDPSDVQPREFDDPYHWMSAQDSATPGFVSEYAKYSIPEDKAELYCYLLVSYNDVMTRAAADKILMRKIERMKQMLKSYIPQFDEAFWNEKAAARKLRERK
ncbi:MAG TPA: hypothetical protein V6D17_14405 [Candidatus Obscuribacterales bacterium]